MPSWSPESLVYRGVGDTGAAVYWDDATNTDATDKIEAKIAQRKAKEEADRKNNLKDFNARFPADMKFWQVDTALGANDIISGIKNTYAQKVNPFTMSLTPKDQIELEQSVGKLRKFSDMSIQQQGYYEKMMQDINSANGSYNNDENKSLAMKFTRPDLYGSDAEKKEIKDIYDSQPEATKNMAYALTEWRGKNMEKFQLTTNPKPYEDILTYVEKTRPFVTTPKWKTESEDKERGLFVTNAGLNTDDNQIKGALKDTYDSGAEAKRNIDYAYKLAKESGEEVAQKYDNAKDWFAEKYYKNLRKKESEQTLNEGAGRGEALKNAAEYIDQEDADVLVAVDQFGQTKQVKANKRDIMRFKGNGLALTEDMQKNATSALDLNTGKPIDFKGLTEVKIADISTITVPEYTTKNGYFELTPAGANKKMISLPVATLFSYNPDGTRNEMKVPYEVLDPGVKATAKQSYQEFVAKNRGNAKGNVR